MLSDESEREEKENGLFSENDQRSWRIFWKNFGENFGWNFKWNFKWNFEETLENLLEIFSELGEFGEVRVIGGGTVRLPL